MNSVYVRIKDKYILLYIFDDLYCDGMEIACLKSRKQIFTSSVKFPLLFSVKHLLKIFWHFLLKILSHIYNNRVRDCLSILTLSKFLLISLDFHPNSCSSVSFTKVYDFLMECELLKD